MANELQEQRVAGAARAREITEMVQRAVAHTREVARGLLPVQLEPGGLIDALRGLATRTEKIFGVACPLKSGPAIQVSDAAVATHLYHIAMEAVANGIRHGHARRIEIKLGREDGQIRLSIRDDGGGMKRQVSDDPGPGLGLQIMRYRAEVIRGTLEFEGAPGCGTTVVCTVPQPIKIRRNK